MDKLKELLTQIRLIQTKERTMQKEKRKRGENFNIFQVLKLSKSETRLHSAFIAELLNAEGSHGLKDAFLTAFISEIAPKSKLNTLHTEVRVEYFIGVVNQNATQGGRIDILLRDNQKHAIIIENKIDAGEGTNQLTRYNNFAQETGFTDYYLLYLTPEGSQPTTLNDDQEHCLCISYREDIIRWLNICVGIAACYPLIRETIRQYIINLKSKEILNMMDTENENKLIETATSPEYIESTLTIMENSWNIQKAIRQRFVEQLKELASSKGFEFYYDEHLCDLWNDQWIEISKPSISIHWGICIGWEKHNKSNGAYYGISWLMDKDPICIPEKRLCQLPHIFKEKQDNWFPYGWEYLYGKDGIEHNGSWWSWNDINTLRDMSNGTMLQFIEKKVLDVIIEQHLLERLEEITNK